MRDLRSDARGVDERPAERRAQKRADLVATEEQRFYAVARILDTTGGVERTKSAWLLRPVSERGRIEREDLGLARARFLPLVESLARLLADPALLEQPLDERRSLELAPGCFVRQSIAQVPQHVAENVD